MTWTGPGWEARRKPAQLSGGMQQRVALARALVNLPKVLLLDEPLGALDLKLRKGLQVELKRIQREVGITFVYVTHDQEEALTMSDRIAVMNRGRVEQIGEPEEVYERPERARRHPVVLAPHDLAELGGRIALVTEFIEGEDLSACIASDDPAPLPVSTQLEVIEQVASALEVAWKQLRLVHRDVKPQNIRIGRHGNVKLLDFGLASTDLGERATHTSACVVVPSGIDNGSKYRPSASQRWRRSSQLCPRTSCASADSRL